MLLTSAIRNNITVIATLSLVLAACGSSKSGFQMPTNHTIDLGAVRLTLAKDYVATDPEGMVSPEGLRKTGGDCIDPDTEESIPDCTYSSIFATNADDMMSVISYPGIMIAESGHADCPTFEKKTVSFGKKPATIVYTYDNEEAWDGATETCAKNYERGEYWGADACRSDKLCISTSLEPRELEKLLAGISEE